MATGVRKRGNRFRADIKIKGLGMVYLGSFDTEEEASEAFLKKRSENKLVREEGRPTARQEAQRRYYLKKKQKQFEAICK